MNNLKGRFNKVVICRNLDELQSFSKVFIRELESGTVGGIVGLSGELDMNVSEGACVVGLSGDLGAGKTTFSKCVADTLGVTEVVSSPTFAIQKQYKTQHEMFEEFVHIDAYRIEDIKEVGTLRFVELFSKPKTLILIEWPEKIAEVLPKEAIILSFESIDENIRKISY
jgi:tRNA threonylcarbamoyladenosine biosynthesis protein TsaE